MSNELRGILTRRNACVPVKYELKIGQSEITLWIYYNKVGVPIKGSILKEILNINTHFLDLSEVY